MKQFRNVIYLVEVGNFTKKIHKWRLGTIEILDSSNKIVQNQHQMPHIIV